MSKLQTRRVVWDGAITVLSSGIPQLLQRGGMVLRGRRTRLSADGAGMRLFCVPLAEGGMWGSEKFIETCHGFTVASRWTEVQWVGCGS